MVDMLKSTLKFSFLKSTNPLEFLEKAPLRGLQNVLKNHYQISPTFSLAWCLPAMTSTLFLFLLLIENFENIVCSYDVSLSPNQISHGAKDFR